MYTDSDDDIPIGKVFSLAPTSGKTKESLSEKSRKVSVPHTSSSFDSDDDDVPISTILPSQNRTQKSSNGKVSQPNGTHDSGLVKKRKTPDSDSDSDFSASSKKSSSKVSKKSSSSQMGKKENKENPMKKKKKSDPLEFKIEESKKPLVSASKKIKSEPPSAEKLKIQKASNSSTSTNIEKKVSIKKEKKKPEKVEEETYKWWEQDIEHKDGVKWKTLEHSGVLLAPEYQPLPSTVSFVYNGKPTPLSVQAEEVAGFYAVMLNTDYIQKKVFNENFFKDWRKVMTPQERQSITDLTKCDFTRIQKYYEEEREKKKALDKEAKNFIKQKNEEIIEHYGYAFIDGRKEKIGNFRVEPPGLFRGRGEHPKMGRLKKRVNAEDIIINISQGAKVPPPPAGHQWKEVIHNNTVTWLASWTENIQGSIKYVMLNPSSSLKGINDMKKYDKARELKLHIAKIREEYYKNMRDNLMFIRQRATALYLIDKLALRAGNEKDSDEEADTVGCCSLRVEHIELVPPQTVKFDFLGKDSIRYQNEVEIDPQAFKNLKKFCISKVPGDLLFDRLNVAKLNKHLQELMPGLTAKVFRTYNASITLNEQVKNTPTNGTVNEKLLAYNRANRAVAVLCNHQRALPKTFGQQMEKMDEKIAAAKEKLKEAKEALKAFRNENKGGKGGDQEAKLAAKVKKAKELVEKINILKTDKDENKTIALGTSKLNYLDPRISVAWAKRHDVPIEKVYNKTQRLKFAWAMDAPEDFEF